MAYTGFLILLRRGSGGRRAAGPLADATAVAAVACLAVGFGAGELDLAPGWAALGWLALLALTSQVLGWLLISYSLPRLPAALTSVLLTAQPVASVALAVLILESPSGVQLLGAATILAGLVIVSTGRSAREPAPVVEAG